MRLRRHSYISRQVRPQKRFVRKLLDLLITAGLLLALTMLVIRLDNFETITGFASISDGDTLVVGDVRIRLYGIDAPELLQYCTKSDGDYPCGRISWKTLEGLASGALVACQNKGRDHYGRVLGECFAGNINLAEEMVRRGWAVSYGAYGSIELQAKSDLRGIWAGEFERPEQWRRNNSAKDDQPNGFATWFRQILGIIFYNDNSGGDWK